MLWDQNTDGSQHLGPFIWVLGRWVPALGTRTFQSWEFGSRYLGPSIWVLSFGTRVLGPRDPLRAFAPPNQWCPFLFNDYNSTQRRICKANSRSHFNLSKILSFLLLYCWENDRIPLFSLSQKSCVYNFFLSRLGRVGPEPEPTLTRTRRMYI